VDDVRRPDAADASLCRVRPLLTPFARRLWRDRETLQLGRSPGRAVVLAGVDPVLRAVLALLDGTRDQAGVLRAAAAAGCPAPRAEAVLTLLADAGLLDDAADDRSALARLERAERDRLAADLGSLRLVRPGGALPSARRRLDARIVVEGAGRVGAAVAALLAVSGVGAVDVVDDGTVRPEDCGVGGLGLDQVGRRRGEAARDLVAGLAPSVRTAALCLPDLVVLAPAAGMPRPDAPRLVPHLLTEVRDGTGVVGPLVQPGASACLHCLDLARTDRDPDWPAVAAQLSLPAPGVAPCDAGLALAVVAQTVLQALLLVDGAAVPATVGGTLELVLPDWRWRRRSWQIHPACACGWRDAG
jgi:hypothetical protein